MDASLSYIVVSAARQVERAIRRNLLKEWKFIKPYHVDDGKKFRLKDFDPADTQGLDLRQEAGNLLKNGIARLSDMQQKLYAQDRWALLLIFQAMDAAGKDSVIRHVMSGVNPQGCQVYAFKAPSTEELSHDFLWRTSKNLPQRGHIGIFNRSYYEEVLVVRVHPQVLAKERIPASLVTKKIWKERFEAINSFESYLDREGVVIRKFFLNVSKTEQKRRFLSRLQEPDKNWKFSEDDVRERERWDDYSSAYEDMIRHTATPHAPWYVVPADHKWFTRLVVASTVIHTLGSLNLSFPSVSPDKKKDLDSARKLLLNEN
ncbi:MAG: polyphosphate kinase 2 family protein [Acidobacteriaceae bacterium]|nr:polyphosphate kinase 2 family protein [Acidobacteriaceae bacterium]MBV9765957.1 polyphosphate kinase 2 family protein [Acidobacteriaceae bacterium]